MKDDRIRRRAERGRGGYARRRIRACPPVVRSAAAGRTVVRWPLPACGTPPWRRPGTPKDGVGAHGGTGRRRASGLTAAQTIALEALLRGATVTDAAKAAGVSRQTVSTWRNQDPLFIAAMNAAARDQLRETHTGLRALAPAALAHPLARVGGRRGNGIAGRSRRAPIPGAHGVGHHRIR